MSSILTICFTDKKNIQSINNNNKVLHTQKPSCIFFPLLLSSLLTLAVSLHDFLHLMFPPSVTRVVFMVCVHCSPAEPHIQKEALGWGLRLYCQASEILIHSLNQCPMKSEWEHGACAVDLESWIMCGPSSLPVHLLEIGFQVPTPLPFPATITTVHSQWGLICWYERVSVQSCGWPAGACEGLHLHRKYFMNKTLGHYIANKKSIS